MKLNNLINIIQSKNINKYNAKYVLYTINDLFYDDKIAKNYIPDKFPKAVLCNFKYSYYEMNILRKNKFKILDKLVFCLLICYMYDDDVYIFENDYNKKVILKYNMDIYKFRKYIKKRIKQTSQYSTCLILSNLNIIFYIGDFGITYFTLIENNKNINFINKIFAKNNFFIRVIENNN